MKDLKCKMCYYSSDKLSEVAPAGEKDGFLVLYIVKIVPDTKKIPEPSS